MTRFAKDSDADTDSDDKIGSDWARKVAKEKKLSIVIPGDQKTEDEDPFSGVK